ADPEKWEEYATYLQKFLERRVSVTKLITAECHEEVSEIDINQIWESIVDGILGAAKRNISIKIIQNSRTNKEGIRKRRKSSLHQGVVTLSKIARAASRIGEDL
ncbi:6821_t:CDS:1, partial [Gigaspora margarita]